MTMLRKVLGRYVGTEGATWEILDCGHHVERQDGKSPRLCWKCNKGEARIDSRVTRSSLDPFDSLEGCMVTDPRDWSMDRKDAWMFGIVVGWSGKALDEVARRHGWLAEAIARLVLLRERFKEARDKWREAIA